MKKLFSKRSAIQKGWDITKKNWQLLVGVTIVIFVVSILVGLLGEVFKDNGFFNFIISILSWLVNASLTLGLVYITLGLLRGRKVGFKDLTSQNMHLLRFIGASILLALMFFAVLCVAGIVGVLTLFLMGMSIFTIGPSAVQIVILGIIALLALAALIWIALRYSMLAYIIVDEEKGVMDSLKRSVELTNGSKWNLLLLQILLILINLVGLIAIFVGLLFTIPLTTVAMTYVYEKLKKAKGGLPIVSEEPEVPAKKEDVSPKTPAENTYRLS